MFCLKKFIITKIINKRRKKQPFDEQTAENFTLSYDGDGTFNNSYYFSAHCPEKKQSLYVRLGLRNNGNAEVWVFFDNQENTYHHDRLLYTVYTSPLKVTNKDGVWGFNFEGELLDKNGKTVQSKVDCAFSSNNQIVDFFSHMPSERLGVAMAQDKWTKDYFAGVQENNSVHYEQEGTLVGTFTIDGVEYQVDLPCVRDHSYGRRVWGYMNNHLWLAGVSKDCLFNFSMVSYPSMSILEEGHLRQKERPIEFVTKVSYDRRKIVTGEIPNELTIVAQIEKKRNIIVKANLLSSIPYVFEDGAYTLIEGIADYEIDGIKCRGILEIGFNKDKERFMNGKKIEKIRE